MNRQDELNNYVSPVAQEPKIYRWLRVLEYSGSLEWIRTCIEKRGVKGQYGPGLDKMIREAMVGELPELTGSGYIRASEPWPTGPKPIPIQQLLTMLICEKDIYFYSATNNGPDRMMKISEVATRLRESLKELGYATTD